MLLALGHHCLIQDSNIFRLSVYTCKYVLDHGLDCNSLVYVTMLTISHTLAVRLPLSIFSKPRASTQFAMFPSTSCLASIRAVDPVEQALLTYTVYCACMQHIYACTLLHLVLVYVKHNIYSRNV